MNYPYAPSMFGGPQMIPSQPVFVPQGVIGSQLGQFAGGIGGQLLPGPFAAVASQLLPQLGTLLPFQAGPQQQIGLAIPHQATVPAPQPAFMPQGVIGSQLGQFVGGIVGHLVPGPFGPVLSQWPPQLGGLLPFQAGPQQSYVPSYGPQGGIGSQFGHMAGGIGGYGLPSPYGGIANQWPQQVGNMQPFQAGPQQLVPLGAFGVNLPFFNVGVQW